MADAVILPGSILAGRYQVRRELGRGGMGVVYLCRDLVVDERVALKLLSRPGARMRPEDAWWFQEEARALAALSHPAIVKARDFGALPDGTPYLAMDAVPGRSLHEWLYLGRMGNPLPWPIIWSTVDQVLGALGHAHARGVIHGDLKPSNVLVDVLPDGVEPTVHILDLGLAWLMQDRVDHRLDGSRESAPTVRWGAGTPGWMAPEQIRFAAPHVGPPTDLYALGCILFAWFANREVYDGTNEEILQQHRSAPIPDVPLPAGVPSDVAKVVKRLLAKRPWHRFDFAGDARRVWKRFEPRGDANSTPLPVSLMTSGRIPPSRDELLTPELLEPPIDDDAPPSVTTTGLLGLRPSPFVARTGERARLMELAAEVIDSPKPVHRFVVLAGEAGVGKSRLAEWLCEEVHERALMIPLRARYRRIAAPLDGIVGAVMQYYRLERAEREIVEKVLMNVWEVSPEDDVGKTWVAAAAEWIRPSSQESHAVGPTGKRFRLDRPELRWLVIRKTLERIGRDRPVLLWLDDVHHASPATFEGMRNLHRESPTLGLLIVTTVRSEAVECDPTAAERIEETRAAFAGERLDVAPLNPSQTQTLLRETLPLDEAAATEAATRSKGNPLFALQLLHAWAGGGHLELRSGKYFVPKASLAVQAATTAELWGERLAALPDDLRDGAYAAAALGGDMRREVLEIELESLDIPAERAIAAMQRAQLLLASGDRLRWPHALLQEHLLSQLYQQPNAARVFRAAAEALARHPAASSRRIVRLRAVTLVRAGAVDEAADLLHSHVASLWHSSRDIAATLRDLAVLDQKVPGVAGGGEGRTALTGARLGRQLRFRADALRLAGRLDEARRDAEEARRIFEHAGDKENQAHCLRLLGNIASDLGAEAQGRRLVARALSLFEELGNGHGQAQCEALLGEIDYLLGEHARARSVLSSGAERFLTLGDRAGRAQCLLYQGMVEQAAPGTSLADVRDLLRTSRSEFDAIGNRLGVAQCDLILSHAEHRHGNLDGARELALAARQSLRDLANPRGEAGCERVLAMVSLDAGAPELAEEHAEAAARIFEKLADPFGQVESRLLFAQIALHLGDGERAREHLIACEAVALAEAEPKQHRHLTLAWLAYHEGRFHEAAREIDAARAAFKDSRAGDHTPQLLSRFAQMGWPKPAGPKISAWVKALGAPPA